MSKTGRGGERTEPVRHTASSSVPPLRANRAFRLLWGAQCFSQLGYVTGVIAYPLLVLQTHGSVLWAGVLGFIASAVGLAAKLPAGLACDRLDRHRILVVGALCRAGAMALLALAAAAGTVPLALVIAVAAIDGGAMEVVRFAERAALRHIVRTGDISAAVAGNEARSQAAGLAGPALGGWLFALASALPFAANAAGHLLSAAMVLGVRHRLQDDSGRRAPPSSGVFREAGKGFAFIRRRPALRVLVVASLCPNAVFGGVTLLIIAAVEEGGGSAAAIGGALSVAGLGGVAGAMAAPALISRCSPAALLLGTIWLLPAAVAALALASGPVAYAALLAACVFTVPVLNAQLTVYQIHHSPDGLQGRTFSATAVAMGAAQPLGPLLGGAGHELLGSVPAFLLLAGLLAASAVCVTAMPTARRLPLAQQPRPDRPDPPLREETRKP